MTTDAVREQRNVDDFKLEFRKYSDAARGVYLVRTREPHRAFEALQELTVEDDTEFRVWQCNKGWQTFPKADPQNPTLDIRKPRAEPITATIDIGSAFTNLSNEAKPGIFVMMHPHHHFEKPLIQQYVKDFAIRALEAPQRLVMLCTDNAVLPNEIRDDVQILDFKTPSHHELVKAWEGMLAIFEGFGADARPEFDEDQIDLVVQNAVGMTQYEFEQAVSIAAIGFAKRVATAQEAGEELPLCTPDEFVRVILEQKVEVIKQTDILELMPAGSMSEVGGFDALKEWLAKRAKAYTKEAADYGIAAPKGAMCVGPPGSGKSLFAKACAGVFGTSLIKLDVGKVFDKYVGNSESRIRSALGLVDAMAPCVLLIDEVDKGFGQSGGGDSGTSQRVLGTFLTWMQERDSRKAPVFVIMTANNVMNLPAELMRKGRLDEIFACTFPNAQEREEILTIHLSKRGHKVDAETMRKVVEATNGFVGAELESIVVEALIDAFDKKQSVPDASLFVHHARSITPLSVSMREKVEFMNEWAKANAKPASSGMKFTVPEPSKSLGGRVLPAVRPMPKTPLRPGRSIDG